MRASTVASAPRARVVALSRPRNRTDTRPLSPDSWPRSVSDAGSRHEHPSFDSVLSHAADAVVIPAGPNYNYLQRNLALELVRVTEAAALGAGWWVGKGDKNGADRAAVDNMRKTLRGVSMDGTVVIGEGEKDQAPMLYRGEHVGDGAAHSPMVDVALDPIDGTMLVAKGGDGAIAVIAVAERGALFDPGPAFYMEKLAVGPQVPPSSVSVDYPVVRNLRAVADALHKPVEEVTVVVLDRPRHEGLIQEIRRAGARIKLISDGDVAAAIEVAKPLSPVDVLMGVGGTPEGVVAACALKCMGGHIEGRLWPRSEDERRAWEEQGFDLGNIMGTTDLCRGERVFFAATGITDGDLVEGVRYLSGGAITHSVVMRSESGTVRWIETHHRWGARKSAQGVSA